MNEAFQSLIEKFTNSKRDYSEVTVPNGNVTEVYNSIKEYIFNMGLPLSVLRCQNRVFLSQNKIEFDQLYEVIKRFSVLATQKGILEIWEDKENRLLNVVFPSVRKHFIIKYSDERDKAEKINSIVTDNPE